MRIIKISVKNLFGIFDYTIPLNLEKRATIIIGPNGSGKTTILKMIDGLFNGNYSIFFRIPFSEFIVEFDNNTSILVDKKVQKTGSTTNLKDLQLIFLQFGKVVETINFADIDFDKNRELLYYATDLLRDEFGNRDSLIRFRKGKDYQNIEDYAILFEKINELMVQKVKFNEINKDFMYDRLISQSDFFGKLQKVVKTTRSVRVHFIKTQRLLSYSSGNKSEKPEKITSMVTMYARELAKQIEATLVLSGEQAQKLDSTFPRRVITIQPSGGHKTYVKLLKELEEIRNKRIHLRDIGILVDLGDDLEITESIDDVNRQSFINGVLTEYIEDSKKKLKVFDELSRKIDLLRMILEDKFRNKKLEVNKDTGFIIKTDNGDLLSLEDLSSGEQHEIVMFYEFLFKVPKSSLVLIDEPELSLHIEWQKKFLKDLIKIANLVEFDVLIATHAPSIINNFWSLAVDLGEIDK